MKPRILKLIAEEFAPSLTRTFNTIIDFYFRKKISQHTSLPSWIKSNVEHKSYSLSLQFERVGSQT